MLGFRLLLAAVTLAQAVGASDPLAGALYRDSSQPVETRVTDLLARMTLEEKAAQLGYALFGCSPSSGGYIGGCNAWAGGGDSSCGAKASREECEAKGSCYWVARGGKQQCLSVGGLDANAQDGPAVRNAVQRKVLETTRLKIPASFYGETTHCGGARGTTVFPMPCSQGSTWNTSLVGAIAAANALELRSAGGDQALSPILQVATDPRFGRLEENFAEDPFLVGSYGVAAVRGLQGDGGGLGPSTYLPEPTKRVASQAKHFAMYGAGGRDGFTPFGGGPSERTLFEIYLRPWRDVMQQAGGRGVMAAHNMIDWLPCHANKRMLTETLRNRFGLGDGYIGSDCGNVEALMNSYTGFSHDSMDAAVQAAEAGVDQDMPGGSFEHLDQAVRFGLISNSSFNRAVANVLRKKFAVGLFESPYTSEAATVNINSPAHRALARQAASEGIILLRNERETLPIEPSAIKTVAVVGPFGGCPASTHYSYGISNGTSCKAKIAMLGGYTAGLGDELRIRVVSVAEAFEDRGFAVTFEQGSDGGVFGPAPADQGAAVAAAAKSDLAVVVIGTMACTCCGKCANGEAGDRDSDFDPEGDQLGLLAAVLKVTAGTKTKVVVVLVHGRPATFGGLAGDRLLLGDDDVPGVDALLAAWRPGEEGGNSIADIILGEVNPSGKTSQAWVRGPGAVNSPSNPWFQPPNPGGGNPPFHNAWRINGDRVPVSPLFPMGFGLSYTNFSFTGTTVDATGIPPGGLNGTTLANATLRVGVVVKNSGKRPGKTAVIVTYGKLTRGVVRYIRMIAAFTKVELAVGQSRQVFLPVRVSDLARYDPQQPWHDLHGAAIRGAYVVDAGVYTFYVGDCVDNSGITSHPVNSAYSACEPTNATVTLGEVDKDAPSGPPRLYGIYL